ncbi:MAG: hypothetical protein SVS15_08760 [Thermodesulfobacteriota bacterium]|nr:hypothetical protein [Thermodesulfobacteriota bacterium]
MKTKLGRQRKPWRIREWLDEQNIQVIELAAAIGVHHSLVSATIHGRRNARCVLRYLKNKGCPEEHLALPEDLLKEAA